MVDDFPVLPKDQQTQPVVQGFREIGGLAIGFVESQPVAYLIAWRVGTEDHQFVPGKSGKTGERDFGLLLVADFLLDRPADLTAGCVAVDFAASGKANDAQGTRNDLAAQQAVWPVRVPGRNRMSPHQVKFLQRVQTGQVQINGFCPSLPPIACFTLMPNRKNRHDIVGFTKPVECHIAGAAT